MDFTRKFFDNFNKLPTIGAMNSYEWRHEQQAEIVVVVFLQFQKQYFDIWFSKCLCDTPFAQFQNFVFKKN